MIDFSLYNLRLIKEKEFVYNAKLDIASPQDVYDCVVKLFELDKYTEEKFIIITLNTKLEIVGAFDVSTGDLSSSIVNPREVFKRAMMNNAAGIICVHNHPSGNPKPSKQDEYVTKRLCDAGNMIGIQVHDHIIIGNNGRFISLKGEGLIK